MTRYPFLGPLLVLLCSLGVPAGAQNVSDYDDLSLMELLEVDVSSASKSNLKVDDAPGIVTVITREDIRNMGADTLEDVLNLVPGMTVGRSFQSGYHQTLYVRGAFSLYAENVLIMKNGRRLNDPTTGGAMTFSPSYPLSGVKQVEIIRGPGSALYGANAFVALVNIITDDAAQNGTEVHAKAGTEHAAEAAFFFGRQLPGDTHLALRVDYRHEEERELPLQTFTQFPSPNPPPFPVGVPFNRVFENRYSNDEATSWNLGAVLTRGAFELTADYEAQEVMNNWGSGVPLETVTDPYGTFDLTDDRFRNRMKAHVFRVGATYTHEVNDRLTITPSVRYADFSLDTVYTWANLEVAVPTLGEGRAAGFTGPAHGTDSLNADLELSWQPAEGHALVAGYQFQKDNVDANTSVSTVGGRTEGGIINAVGPPQPTQDMISAGDRSVHALYAQYTWQVNKAWALTGGVRGDDYSDFGSTVNPRFSVVYRPVEKFNIKALYGQAFRAPTLLETNNFVAGAILPAPDLKPESIHTYELQFNLKPMPTLRAGLSLYSYKVDDVIRQVPTFNGNFETQGRNQGVRSGDGLEFELRYQPAVHKMFFVNYSYVSSTDDNGLFETDVEGVPQEGLNFGFVYDFTAHWVFGLAGYHRAGWVAQSAAPLPDIEIPGYGVVQVDFLDELSLPDYTIVNLHLARRELAPGLDLMLDVENLLDEQRYFGDQHLFVAGGIPVGSRIYKLGASWAF